LIKLQHEKSIEKFNEFKIAKRDFANCSDMIKMKFSKLENKIFCFIAVVDNMYYLIEMCH